MLEKIIKNEQKLIFRIMLISLALGVISFFKYYMFTSSTSVKGIIKSIYSFSGIIVIIFLLGVSVELFKNKSVKKALRSCVLFIIIVLTSVEILLLFNFNTFITPSTLQIFVESNIKEANEFMSLYFNKNLLYLLIISALIFLLDKFFWKNFKIKSIKYKSLILGTLILSVIINIHMIKSNRLLTSGNSFTRLYASSKIVKEDLKAYNEILKNLKKDKIELVENNSSIKNIILIIGESTGRNHMSLYNYDYETNPNLKKLEEEKKLYKFSDVVSPHSHTIPVLKKLLTYQNLESTFEWNESDNIIDIMKAAGFKTQWISNQESFGIWGNVAAAIASKSDSVIFNNIRNSQDEVYGQYDEQLLSKFNINNTEKTFTVLHLMGSHSAYKARYPERWNKFTKELHKNNGEIISTYDNSILYNDYVINEVYNKVKDEEAIILYLSDHGEEVFDFRDFVGHAESNGSRYMIEIPFMFIVTEKFKEKYPQKLQQIKAALNKPYMSDDTIFTILDLADIKTKEFDEKRSLINEKFNFKRKRIFNNKNYDLEMKEDVINEKS